MKHTFIKLLLGMVAVVLVSCAPAPIRPVASDDMGAAYGNINLPVGNITNVMLYKVGEIYAPPFKSPPKGHFYTNGNFFFENLTPGKYFLMGFMSGQDAYYFNYRGIKEEEFIKEVAMDVKPGSLTYFGSFKVTGIDRNLIKADTFDIVRTKTPSKTTILSQLKEAVAGTGWDQRIASALK